MAEQADVYVKNSFDSDIVVTRIVGSSSEDTTIGNEIEEKFPLLVSEELLIINVPDGKDTKDWSIIVRSSIIDLKVGQSSTRWTLRIISNELPPEVPTTVNVNVGQDPP